MNTVQQYQYFEMMRQSRNAAIYQIFSMQGSNAGISEDPNPPEPPIDPKTLIKFKDGTSEYFDFSGEINRQTLIEAGLYDEDSGQWEEISEITFGKNVTSIGEDSFDGCESITSLVFSDSVTTIGISSFYYCSELSSVKMGNGITTIESSAFVGCTKLTSLTMSNSIKTIGSDAFNSTGLTSLTIPNSIESIGNDVFIYCDVIQLTFEGKTRDDVTELNYENWSLKESTCASDRT